MAITIPNIFVPNTLVQSTPVNANFSTIETYINTQLESASAHAADIALLPKGKIGFVQVTANQGSITTVVDLTSLTVTWTAVASRYYKITGWGLIQTTVADDVFAISITDGGGTQSQQANVHLRVANQASFSMPQVVIQPGAGSKTVKLRALRVTGTGTGTLVASSNNPAFILVEDIGL
jgi:hypothetical protein